MNRAAAAPIRNPHARHRPMHHALRELVAFSSTCVLSIFSLSLRLSVSSSLQICTFRVYTNHSSMITINAASSERVSKVVRKLTGGGADIALEVIGNPRTIEEALECLRVGGRLCVVGYTNEVASIAAGKIMFKELEVVGSLGCRPLDYRPLIRLVELGKIDVKKQVTHRFPLHELGRAFEVMKEGVSLRSIVVPSEG